MCIQTLRAIRKIDDYDEQCIVSLATGENMEKKRCTVEEIASIMNKPLTAILEIRTRAAASLRQQDEWTLAEELEYGNSAKY